MPRRALLLALFIPVGLAGCSIFSGMFKTNASTSSNAGSGGGGAAAAPRSDAQQEREAELSEAHRRLAGELDGARQAIAAEGLDSARALLFADLTRKAYETDAVARGRIDGPTVAAEAIGYLEQARAAEPAAAVDLNLALGAIDGLLGDVDGAAAAYAAVIAAEPRVDAFGALVGLGPGPATDDRVVDACPKVRPLIGDDGLADFMAICLERAGGDAKRLAWKGSKQDLVAYRAELQRREEEAKRREAEEAKAREEEAKEAAKRELYQIAAVFAAGRCEFGDCAHRGWSVRTDQGEVRVTCEFGECLTRGWEARFPDGKSARTSCEFGECLQRGWETRFPDGSSARTSCSFGECATRGWETRLPDGSTSRTSCSFGECFTRGWETSLPGGGSVRCTCSFGECLTRGTECS